MKVLLSLTLAFMAESFTEYVFGSWLDLLKRKYPALEAIEPLKYIALAVGLALAFAYQLDVIKEAFGESAVWAPTGIILTGLALGRGANWMHDLWSKYLRPGEKVSVMEIWDDNA